MRNRAFDVLRLFFALLVIWGHSYEILNHQDREFVSRFGLTYGTIAVDGFFVLSGYLITLSWYSEPRRTIPHDWSMAVFAQRVSAAVFNR